jgi:hypothetical protein
LVVRLFLFWESISLLADSSLANSLAEPDTESMNRELTNLADAITALQIKLAALESIVLRDEPLRAEYARLVDEEMRRVLATRIPAGPVC